KLAPADRALCQEMVYGVVRWQAALDWLIARRTDGREQKPGLQLLLRLGVYQIAWLDRIPPHAAVFETVELAKQLGFGPQAGFMNAVLRETVRDLEPIKLQLAELKTTQPHIAWSHPEWLVQRWTSRWGAENTAKLLEWDNAPAAAFARVNTLRTDATKLIEKWREENVEYDFARWDWVEENFLFRLKSHPPLARLESFKLGWFYVQDPSTLLAVRELAPQPGENILDVCAAPGGKTTLIAQLMNNTGRVLAEDVSPERLKLVTHNSQRLGIACIETALSPDSAKPLTGLREYDRVLVDAPCSNTGVLRRRVDARWRVTLDEIARLRAAQLDLLARSALRLKPGGTLVYSTCSLEPEENSEVVKTFLASHPRFALERERELLPFVEGVDGAYVARLKRSVG
ncbi:MAG: 16S rRNA (cytosine(967)-C(5))-methyltransferase RsmB, partial [Verrucomicrobia bacterium]|nr:16S rRNA (cytosine(967)-C(5))-methyltransferase RsmB [Verrucomicrobiota bacterium]